MPSKQVTDREKSARAVIASADAHGAEVQAALEKRLARYLRKGETMPDVGLAVELFGRELDDRARAMTASDEAHEHELGDDAKPRDERDAAFAALLEVLVERRELFVGLYGRAAAQSVGFTEKAPQQDAQQLVRFGQKVARTLRTAKLPPPRVQASVDVKAMAAEIDGLCDRLARALDDVAREEREAQATLGRKNADIAAYDASFTEGAGVQSALLRAAGRADLADRVRPSTRRPGRTEEDAPIEDDPATTPPTTATGG